jgi:hypothetical protein
VGSLLQSLLVVSVVPALRFRELCQWDWFYRLSNHAEGNSTDCAGKDSRRKDEPGRMRNEGKKVFISSLILHPFS